ncbi:MAG TPA: carboxymuconolactone decarboxylase family protein [Chloroflexota bacterium]|nr:carboxymuconolactone decarboxylase family protein [Chloroflexota bacterium]
MTPLPPFLQKLAAFDAAFVEQAAAIREQAYYTPSALDVKTKLLIALALDVAHGSEEGVQLLSARARDAGANDAEIADVLRVCYSVAGLQCLSTGAKALN